MGIIAQFVSVIQNALQQQLLFTIFIATAAIFLSYSISIAKKPKFICVPTFGVDPKRWFSVLRARSNYKTSGFWMLQKGHEQHSNEIFQVHTLYKDMLILPTKYIEELKSLPEQVMSTSAVLSDSFMGRYTGLTTKLFGHVIWQVLRGNLTQNLGNLVEPIHDECHTWFNENFDDCRDWKPICIHPTLQQIVGRITARVFVGKDLARNQTWIKTSIDFSTCVIRGCGTLKIIPWILRPLVALFSPYMHGIRRNRRIARELLIPEIDSRRSSRENADENERPKDMLDWLDEASTGNEKLSEYIVERQLGLHFAAIHTTTNNLANVILDLAFRWEEYAPELRKEIEEVFKETEGVMHKMAVTKLSKLDSFMKESQRLSPPSGVAFSRKVMQSHTLSDEQVLPKSSYIAMASGAIAMSSYSSEFDGFRFHRLREEAEATGKNKSNYFVTTSAESFIFGHGSHACPGRFFAGLETKMILVEILQNFDLKLPDRQTDRPRNIVFSEHFLPNPKNMVLFRRREVAGF